MNINQINPSVRFIIVAAVFFTAGYAIAPKEQLDQEVTHSGFAIIDTKRVLSATVESLKSEFRLVSYSFVGNQNVSIDRSYWGIFNGYQQLSVPATISYFVELDKLQESSVVYDQTTNTVTIMLPKLMLTVDFDPRRSTITNSGMPTMNDSVVQALTKLNYDTARRSAIKQGQGAEFVRLAKETTAENIQRLFRTPLQIAGKKDVKILVKFPH